MIKNKDFLGLQYFYLISPSLLLAFRGGEALVVLWSLILAFVYKKKYNLNWNLKENKLFFSVLVFSFLSAIPHWFMDNFRGRVLNIPLFYLLFIPFFLIQKRFNFKEYFFKGFFIGAFLFSLKIFYNFFILQLDRGGFSRAISIGYLASLSCVILLTGIIYFISKAHYKKKHIAFFIISFILCFLTMLISQTRMAWIAFLCLFLYIFLLRKYKFYLLIFIFVILLGIIQIPFIKKRMFQLKKDILVYKNNKNTSVGIRLNLLKINYLAFKQNIFFGLGYKKREEFFSSLANNPKFELLKKYKIRGHDSAHNEIIHSLATKGILGGIKILLLYLIPLIICLKLFKKNKLFSITGICLVFNYIVLGLGETPLNHHKEAVFYCFVFSFLINQLQGTKTKQMINNKERV